MLSGKAKEKAEKEKAREREKATRAKAKAKVINPTDDLLEGQPRRNQGNATIAGNTVIWGRIVHCRIVVPPLAASKPSRPQRAPAKIPKSEQPGASRLHV